MTAILYLVLDHDTMSPTQIEQLECWLPLVLTCGVDMLQVRCKSLAFRDFMTFAQRAHAIAQSCFVPLIINDRLDIAMLIDADGIHLGQDDMPLVHAIKLWSTHTTRPKIYGVTVRSPDQAILAESQGASYLGTDAVFETITKTYTTANPPLGYEGLKQILASVKIRVYAIGGLEPHLLKDLFHNTSTLNNTLGGACFVKTIIKSDHPENIVKSIRTILDTTWIDSSKHQVCSLNWAYDALEAIRKKRPLIHHLSNLVVMDFSANLTLAIGASPLMAHAIKELEEIVAISDALVVNIGTLDDSFVSSAEYAIVSATKKSIPIILDPVGIGASAYRLEVFDKLATLAVSSNMNLVVIKGNLGEITALAGYSAFSHGVDASDARANPTAISTLLKGVAIKYRSIIVCTGPVDYITDGHVIYSIHNGNALLTRITGSGCGLGSIIAAFAAVAATSGDLSSSSPLPSQWNLFQSSVASVLTFTIASEIASKTSQSLGPGSLKSLLLDAIYHITKNDFLSLANLSIL